jgi:DNA-binding NtrC family response regulator
VGRGSTFRISLPPFVPAAAEADAKVTTALRRVLVVDDDVGVSRAIARLLRRYDVTTARSADEALEHVRRDPPFDVVFSDLRMPDKDGLAFHAALMEVDPVLARRTAFVTSALGERDLFEIRRRGVPIFDKPINVRKLLDFCDEVIPVEPPP